MSFFLKISLLASILSLAVAYGAQYGFGLMPCELCIMQRIPYAVVIALSLMALFMPGTQKGAGCLIIAAFIAGGGIATYHSLVEKHVVAGPTKCTSASSSGGESVDELLNKIRNAPAVACDKPQWEFHGITMALLNAVWSFLLAAFLLSCFRRSNAKTSG